MLYPLCYTHVSIAEWFTLAFSGAGLLPGQEREPSSRIRTGWYAHRAQYRDLQTIVPGWSYSRSDTPQDSSYCSSVRQSYVNFATQSLSRRRRRRAFFSLCLSYFRSPPEVEDHRHTYLLLGRFRSYPYFYTSRAIAHVSTTSLPLVLKWHCHWQGLHEDT